MSNFIPLTIKAKRMPKMPRKRVRIKKSVAIYCGPASLGQHAERRWPDFYAAKAYADQRRNFWDFDEADCFYDAPSDGRKNRECLIEAVRAKRYTDVVCFAVDRIGSTEEIKAFKDTLRQYRVRLHVVMCPKRIAAKALRKKQEKLKAAIRRDFERLCALMRSNHTGPNRAGVSAACSEVAAVS